VALSRDLSANNLWVESLERSLARRGRPRRASLELGKLTPARDLSDPDNVAESVVYWRTRRAASSGSSLPAAGGATALALLAATTLPSITGGHSDSSTTIVRDSASRTGSHVGNHSVIVQHTASNAGSQAPAATGASSGTVTSASTIAPAKVYGEVLDGSVASVQRMLGLTADGVLGPGTGAAIRQFQTAHGLTANGVVDETTFNAMQAIAPVATGPGIVAHSASADAVDTTAAVVTPSVAATAPVAVAPVTDPATTTDANTSTDGTGGAVVAATATDATSPDTAADAAVTQPVVPTGVAALQTALHLPADGTFGSDTKAAVIAFQTAHGLNADGVVGPDTRAALDLGDGPTLQDTEPPPPPPVTTTTPAATTPAASTGASTTTTTPSTTTTTPAASSPAPAAQDNGTAPDAATGLDEMVQAADAIATLPYIWGGGHGSFVSPGYDCSGSVSYVLHAAGLLSVPEDSSALESYGAPGPGKYITIYATDGHAWMTIDGRRFDTVALSEDGSRWASGGGEFAGYVERHPVGY
jgi:peptidoglycan hydrolase-like protein with peptidoglycan-binding domain